jgi:hypothetical protein
VSSGQVKARQVARIAASYPIQPRNTMIAGSMYSLGLILVSSTTFAPPDRIADVLRPCIRALVKG